MNQTRQRLEPAWAPPRERAASTGEASDASVSAPPSLHIGPGRGPTLSLFDRPTARTLHSAAVLGLQRTHGNAHVARLLIQRSPLLMVSGCQTASADVVIGTDEEKKRFGEIRKIMEASPTGQEGLAVLDKHTVKIVFVAGGASQYDPSANTIKLNSAKSDADAALVLVHELNHARYTKEGLDADVMALSREEYIKQTVEEEVEGAVKSIEAKIELEGTQIDVSKTSYPQEKEYRTAYQQAIDAARLKDPAISEDDLKKLGREAGKARVMQGFMDGEVVSGRTKKTYPQEKGEYWDKMHP